MQTTIIIPTYNESENISSLIQEIFSRFPNLFILVVDDNSPDGTAEIVRQNMAQYKNLSLLLREKKEGLGKAYLDAFSRVLKNPKNKRIIMMDADFSHNPKYLHEILEKSQRYDLVVGSRYVDGGGVKAWNFWRRLLSLCGNMYAQKVTAMPVSDCTAGFNSINTKMLRNINFADIEVSGYAFQIHLKYLLWKSGATICEVPISFTDRILGKSKLSSHIIQEGIILPWKIRFKK